MIRAAPSFGQSLLRRLILHSFLLKRNLRGRNLSPALRISIALFRQISTLSDGIKRVKTSPWEDLRRAATLSHRYWRTFFLAVAGGTELTAPRSRPFAQAACAARAKFFAPCRDIQQRAEDISRLFSKVPSDNLNYTTRADRQE